MGCLAKDPVVNTTHGRVQGLEKVVLNKTINSFFGIPFAKPPVGNLRFKRPEPLPSWGEELKDAKVSKHKCMQLAAKKGSSIRGDTQTPSEDCLHLNIWVPADARGNHTTLVWLFGGAFIIGSISSNSYQGHYIAATNDVIVATINYRLGSFGFLYTGNDDAPGNQGLLDQAMGMKWIRDNIERFGGDPSKITLFGESAGAASVNFHLLSPKSRDLFGFAILESGTAQANWAFQDAATIKVTSADLAVALGCPSSDESSMMDCMRKVDGQKIVNKQLSLITYKNPTPWAPVVDGNFLPFRPEEMLQKGDIKNTSVIIGINKHEGSLYIKNILTRRGFLASAMLVAAMYNDTSITPGIVNEYDLSIVPSLRPSYYELTVEMFSDFLFKCPAGSFAQTYSAMGNKVFLYSLEHRSDLCPFPKALGVAHTCDLELVFGRPLDDSLNSTEDDKRLSQQMMKYWTSFAKTG